AHLAGDPGYLAPSCPREVAEEHETRSPDDASGDVVRGELEIRDLGHAGEAGNHDPEGRGEPPEEHRRATTASQEILGFVQVLIDLPADEWNAADHRAQEQSAPALAHDVPDAVPDDRTADGG